MAPTMHIVDTMSFSRAVASGWLRIPLLIGTVIATVATSGPGWSLDAETTAVTVDLAPGQSTEARATFEGSHPVRVSAEVRNLVPGDGKLRMERFGDCATASTFEGKDGSWRLPPSDRARDPVTFGTTCDPLTTTGETAVKITNAGQEPIRFDVQLRAEIDGHEDDEPPAGAFVKIESVP